MATLETFGKTLKEVVQAKRLSASKMGKLTDLALKLMENDTQLVSILYRTHKSLPTASKVSSLYAFDALSRAARSQVNKHGLTGDINAEKGNCATFLMKVEGVLDGLFHDLISTGNAGTKEKSQKILDIWVKANTFPPAVLAALANIVNGSGKETELATESRSLVQATETSATTSTSSIPVSAPPILPNTEAVQSTLLALLSQATNTGNAAVVNGQTTPNTVLPQLDGAQLALLHQLAQTAKLANEGQKPVVPPLAQPAPPPVPSPATPQIASPNPTRFREGHSGPSFRDARNDRHGSPSRNRDDHYDDHPASRGGFRGGFRGRGRGDGRPRWEDRDRYGGRSPPMRGRRSRSRSPPSRHGGRRDIKPYSPPRRPSMTSPTMQDSSHNAESVSLVPEVEKDEFGRDLRPLPPNDEPGPAADVKPRSPSPPPGMSTTSATMAPSTSSDSTAVSPPPSITNPPQTSTSSSNTSTQPGLDNFDITTFDFTSPASWEALGKMWQVTHGQPPSQEALMQFVMSKSTVGAGMGSLDSYSTSEQEWSAQGWAGDQGEANFENSWQGRGMGRFPRGGGGAGYNMHENQRWNYGQETDAIVLGGGTSTNDDAMLVESTNENQPSTQTAASTVGSGGRMQRVGDKWVFVRETPSNTV